MKNINTFNIDKFLLELNQALDIVQMQEFSSDTLEDLQDIEEIKSLSLPNKYTSPY